MIFTNYIQIAGRKFSRNKFYSMVNAFGLSIGIAFSLLVYTFIKDEHSFDQFHKQKDFIYRINSKRIDGQALMASESEFYNYSAILPNALADVIREQMQEAEHVMVMKFAGQRPVTYDQYSFTTQIDFVDSTFFNMFSFHARAGSTRGALTNTTDAVITPEVATRLFGTEDPIGKTFFLDYEELSSPAFTVRAVIDCPANSSLQFEVLIPLEAYKPYRNKSWNLSSYPIFVQLRPDADPEAFAKKINGFIETHRAAWVKGQRNYFKMPEEIAVEEYTLTSLTDIHFDKKVAWTKVSDKKYAWILSSMAVLIILIACINYISFSLASASTRNKEIGIRKTIGATSNQIFAQFTMESMGICLIASSMGFLIAMMVLPLFNFFVQKQIHVKDFQFLQTVGFLLFLTVVIGLVAGSYPSFLLSRLNPRRALKGSVVRQPSFINPMVVLQFVMSAFLIISSVIMYRQMNYVVTKDLGFSADQVITIETNLGWTANSDKAIERFRAATANNTDIVAVSGSSGSFIRGSSRRTVKVNDLEHLVYFCRVDPFYVPLLNIEIKEGRNFLPVEDSLSIIVNETLVKDMGWSDPLGQTFNPKGPDFPGYRVIGVMKDYHFLSLEEEIKPIFLSASESTGAHMITMMVKLKGENLPRAIASAQNEWKKLYPDKPFDYSFAEDQLAKQYEVYERWTHLAGIAALLAAIIAGLGMFGIAGISATARTKEIAVRKVLGANLSSIFLLLNRPYIFMSIVAFLLAAPATWYLMTNWIASFKYHIAISWEIFFIGIFTGLLIALISVSYHGWKTANVNPAEALRSE